jgi:hypothetical protein
MPSRSRVKFKTSIYQWIVLYTFKPSTYRVHSLEKYSIFSTSTAIDQKTRSVHIYGHLNTYILLFDYRTLLVYTLQLTFKVGVSSVFECYWLMEYNGGRRIASQSKQTVRGGPKPAKVGLHRRLSTYMPLIYFGRILTFVLVFWSEFKLFD